MIFYQLWPGLVMPTKNKTVFQNAIQRNFASKGHGYRVNLTLVSLLYRMNCLHKFIPMWSQSQNSKPPQKFVISSKCTDESYENTHSLKLLDFKKWKHCLMQWHEHIVKHLSAGKRHWVSIHLELPVHETYGPVKPQLLTCTSLELEMTYCLNTRY